MCVGKSLVFVSALTGISTLLLVLYVLYVLHVLHVPYVLCIGTMYYYTFIILVTSVVLYFVPNVSQVALVSGLMDLVLVQRNVPFAIQENTGELSCALLSSLQPLLSELPSS